MVLEIGDRLGCSTSRDIVWSGDEAPREFSDFSVEQATVSGLAGADHNVKAFVDDIGEAVADVQLKIDLGISFHKGADCRHEQR